MHHVARFTVLLAVLLVSTLAIGQASAQAPEGPEVAACLPGLGYAPGCDVNQDGQINILDLQLTASRWNSSGVYTSGHDHFGETWSGVRIGPGLEIRNNSTAVGAGGIRGVTAGGFGVYGGSESSFGMGVVGWASATSGPAYGVYGDSASTDGRGVYGWARAGSGETYGVYGRSDSTSGSGVFGLAFASSGTTYGVYGETASSDGRGVLGHANATSGATRGVAGRSDSTSGRGVFGWASASSGDTYGVYGLSDSTTGRGLFGWAAASTGANQGVYGRSSSTSGSGVIGWASNTSGTNYGVAGQSDSTSGRGVYGWAPAASGTTYGVYGRADSPNGYAGYFQGRTHVTGTLSKGGGSFKIDHPLDPANKYLYHSFVESPDMMNVYNGNVALDAAGEAWVELPEWFEALNRDFRYQLTAIGAPGPNLYIAQPVKENRFQIAGGQPGARVSWQVTGIRQDAFANANRIPVEEDKPADERGLYLHPEALGQPKELGLDYQRDAGLYERPEPDVAPVR